MGSNNNSAAKAAATKAAADQADDVTIDASAEELQKEKEELQAEIESLRAEKAKAIEEAIGVDANVEERIREEYQSGALNYQQLANKYRFSVEAIRGIIGDADHVEEGLSLNELPAEL